MTKKKGTTPKSPKKGDKQELTEKNGPTPTLPKKEDRQMTRHIESTHTHMEKLYKLIPAEIVAAYLSVKGVIPVEHAKEGLIVLSALLLIITPLYLRYVQKVRSKKQIIISCLSFILWLYCLGGPFEYFNIYISWVSSILLILWTSFVPLFFKLKKEEDLSLAGIEFLDK